MSNELPHETCLEIINLWETRDSYYPPLKKIDIAAQVGCGRDVVGRTIKNADGIRRREELKGIPKAIMPIGPLVQSGKQDNSHRVNHSIQKSSVVLVIPDLHCPWEHQDALAFLVAVRDKIKPDIIVNLGDEVDFYGMSRFDHDPDVMNPGGELSLAIKHLIPYYREFPDMLVCQSNHTHRVHAKASKAGLPASTVKSIEEILKTPEGWIYKYCHTIDGVDYKHGTGKSGANAHINHAKATGRSTCIGHIHAHAGVNYLRPGLFAANFACLIDKAADCFKYAADMDDNIVLGCGVVSHGKKATFIPMPVDENNRWTGEL